MTYKASNFASSTLAVGLGGTIGDTTLQIQVGDVAKFPVINDGGSGIEFTMMVLTDPAKNREVIRVTRHDTGSASFTVQRAQEGTSARVWQSGDSVSVRLTAGVVTQTYTHPSQATGAHAATAISFSPTGDIGSTNVQAAIAELDTEKSPVGHTHAAGAITFTPAGGIAATNVQAAISELDSEKLSSANGAVATANLADNAVTSGKIADNAVTQAKLADNAVGTAEIIDLNVTTAKIADDAVTFAKMQHIATARFLGRTTAGSGDVEELTGAQAAALLSISDASETVKGLIELATAAEAQTGTDAVRAITPSTLKSAQIRAATAVNSTSGTVIDYGSIPSWVKRITVTLNQVSTSGTSLPIIQLGDSGGFETASYIGATTRAAAAVVTSSYSTGFALCADWQAAWSLSGVITIALQTGDIWAESHALGVGGGSSTAFGGGIKGLSATLNSLRITTVNGTDTFDGGSVNILFE